ncbi:receptor-type tyrosine-protein phosphatase epsilon-like isoform X1 [Cloeon dipterum]|uniref:receptor-type tyrosine-protein phosphatase epsilon-like isoform X1 n=1 Tax=Cloeon dipterum TaxID=197152 RepID=UPI0032203671
METAGLRVESVNSKIFSIGLARNVAPKDELCKPVSLTVLYNNTETIIDQRLDKLDFNISVYDCNCGEHKITLTITDSLPDTYLFTCMNCQVPPEREDHTLLISLSVAFIFLILAVLPALGVWFCSKKWKKTMLTSPPSVKYLKSSERATIQKSPLIENQDADERLSHCNTTEVEQYLQSALVGNFLKEQFEKFPRGQTQSWNYGTKPENKSKNRYKNLAAYDSSRVKLQLLPGDANSDYINANYVDGYKQPKAYIASQGPKADTLNDFWRMVWQEKISLIVMVTNILEGGKKKCEVYWSDVKQEVRYGFVTVRTIKEELGSDFLIRTMSVTRDQIERIVRQLHYTGWPDHGVPNGTQSMVNFIDEINQYNNKQPILVHCSAGVGRTGTVILIDACLRMNQSHGKIDAFAILTRMRVQRANLVDNLAQLEFAFLVLLEKIANPKFEISCVKFSEEYINLMRDHKRRLREEFAKISVICERDFQRAETPVKNETNKCRHPKFISSSNHIVRLFPYENVVTMSFVNGVTVDGYKKPKQFIATQVPMKNTVEDFWRMVDQFNVKEVVVLNEPHVSEPQFLPTNQRSLIFGGIEVILENFEEYQSVKTLNITLINKAKYKNVSVKCASFGWIPGEVAPPSLKSLFDLWGTLKISNEKDVISVVCHDGVTACGLFLGVGFVIEKIKLEHVVDPGLAVRTMRKSRPAFISSQVQYELLLEAAKHYLYSFDTYGNFK